MPGQTFPNSVVKSIQTVSCGNGSTTINAVDPDKTLITGASLGGNNGGSGAYIDGMYYYLSNSTTVTGVVYYATSGSSPTMYLSVVEFY